MPLLAVGALEVADLDEPDLRPLRSANARAVRMPRKVTRSRKMSFASTFSSPFAVRTGFPSFGYFLRLAT